MSYSVKSQAIGATFSAIAPMLPIDAVDMVFERETSIEVTVLVSLTTIHPGAGFSFTSFTQHNIAPDDPSNIIVSCQKNKFDQNIKVPSHLLDVIYDDITFLENIIFIIKGVPATSCF